MTIKKAGLEGGVCVFTLLVPLLLVLFGRACGSPVPAMR